MKMKPKIWVCAGLLTAALAAVLCATFSIDPDSNVTSAARTRRTDCALPAVESAVRDIPLRVHALECGGPARGGASLTFTARDARPLFVNAQSDNKKLQVDPAQLCEHLRQAINSKDHASVARCRKELMVSGAQAVDSLVALLNCGTPQVEIEALRLLVQIRDTRAIAIALGRMLTLASTNPRFSEYLAVFGNCCDEDVGDWLVTFLGNTDRPDLRQRILLILKHLRGGAVVASLAFPVETGTATDNVHASECISSLTERADASHVSMLKTVFETSQVSDVRRAAARGLANVGNAEASEFLVAQAADWNNGSVYCLEVIPTITSTYGQETLLAAAHNSALPQNVRTAVVTALLQQNSPRVQTSLSNLAGAPEVVAAPSAEEAEPEQFQTEDKTEKWF